MDTRKALLVAIAACVAQAASANMFKADIVKAKKKIKMMPYRTKRYIPVRCQEYGHTASSYENEDKCEQCSES